jgi:ketosteroid isomerase-like protein
VSQENVDVARRSFDAWNRRDMDSFLALYDEDAVFLAPANWPDPKPSTGHAAIRKVVEGLREPWDEDRLEAEAFLDVGDYVAVPYQWRVRGRDSGIEGNISYTLVHLVRGGKIVRTEFYEHREQALEAVGLSK